MDVPQREPRILAIEERPICAHLRFRRLPNAVDRIEASVRRECPGIRRCRGTPRRALLRFCFEQAAVVLQQLGGAEVGAPAQAGVAVDQLHRHRR